MREISAKKITEVVSRLCVEANNHLPGDMKACIEGCHAQETTETLIHTGVWAPQPSCAVKLLPPDPTITVVFLICGGC